MGIKLRAMKIKGPLLKGKFLDRPNRFITHIELNDEVVVSHLPDPGRLQELLVPDASVWLRPAPKGTNRRTSYSTVMVEQKGELISLDTTLPNRFLKNDFNELPMFKGWQIIRSEVQVNNHRIDYLLADQDGNEVYTEIKSVSYVENGIAKFPDAVTVRGRKHIELLTSLKKNGINTLIIFICQRSDAFEFQPMWNRDPAVSKALVSAEELGVEIKCFTTDLNEKEMTFSKEIPVNLTPPNET